MTIILPLFPVTVLQLQETSVEAIDIETGFSDTDLISLSLPNFPAPSIDFANSFLSFTSNPDGDFNVGPSWGIAWDKAESVPTTVANHKLEFKRSLIRGVNKKQITGIQLRIAATANCTVRVLALRLLKDTWKYAPVDINTRYERLVQPVSRSGNASPSSEFPAFSQAPNEWPILWRSDHPSSYADPTPVDAHMTVAFHSGSMLNENRISTYFREKSLDYVTQLDLNGDLMTLLNGNPQPDFGPAEYLQRTQLDIDGATDTIPGSGMQGTAQGLDQGALQGTSQFDLERKIDLAAAAYIEARFEWGASGASLSLYDAENGPFQTFTIPSSTLPGCTGANICPNQDYVLRVNLEEHGLHFQVNRLDVSRIGATVFDSHIIQDQGLFKRRKGRVGWYANIDDGDAYISSIKPSYTNFAEYRSQPYRSITPVVGAQLFAGASEPRELYRGIFSGPWGGEFEGNPGRSPESFRIINLATLPLQGFQTNKFYIESFAHTDVSFDLYISQEALDAGTVEAFLWNGFQPLPLSLYGIQGDAWESVSLNLRSVGEDYLPGEYSLVLVQTVVGTPNDWFVDNISVRSRRLEWEGRAYAPDPWTEREEDWVSFHGTVNNGLTGGVLFKERSRRFQIRGKALAEEAEIGTVRTIPKYAELGRLIWGDEKLDKLQPPSAYFDFSVSGKMVTFEGTGSDSDGFITAWTWTLGDGNTSNGPYVTHEYQSSGAYPVTLVVTDNNGLRHSIKKTVTV